MHSNDKPSTNNTPSTATHLPQQSIQLKATATAVKSMHNHNGGNSDENDDENDDDDDDEEWEISGEKWWTTGANDPR